MSTFQPPPIPAPLYPPHSKGQSVLSQGWWPCFRQLEQAGSHRVPSSSTALDLRCFFMFPPKAQCSVALRKYFWADESCGLLSFSGSPAEFGMKGK